MITNEFLDKVAPMLVAGMGTEHVGPQLYSLLRMIRPQYVMEVGLGYTTPFILQALADNKADYERDKGILQNAPAQDERRMQLLPEYFNAPYEPKLVAIDDYSQEATSATRVLETSEALGLSPYLELIKRDFHGASRDISEELLPFDFAWLDCGGTENYRAFFEEFWPLVNPNGGFAAVHFTYRWQRYQNGEGELDEDVSMMPVNLVHELQAAHAEESEKSVEVLSLIEPHKWRQGSMTLLRRVPAEEQRCYIYHPKHDNILRGALGEGKTKGSVKAAS